MLDTHPADSRVDIYDTRTMTVTQSVTGPTIPNQIAVDPGIHIAYVASASSQGTAEITRTASP